MPSSSFDESILLHNFLDSNPKPRLEHPKPSPAPLPFGFLATGGSMTVDGPSDQLVQMTSPGLVFKSDTPDPSEMIGDDAHAIVELWSISQRFASKSLPHLTTIFGEKAGYQVSKYYGAFSDKGCDDTGAFYELWSATWTFLQMAYDFYSTRSKVALSISIVDSLVAQCRLVGEQAVKLLTEFSELAPELDISFLADSWNLCDHLYMNGQHASQIQTSATMTGIPLRMNTLELYITLTAKLLKSGNFAKGMEVYVKRLSKEDMQLRCHAKSLILASWQVAELLLVYPGHSDPDRILDSVWMLSADLKKTVHHQTFHRNWCHSNALKLAQNLGPEAVSFVRAAKGSYKNLEELSTTTQTAGNNNSAVIPVAHPSTHLTSSPILASDENIHSPQTVGATPPESVHNPDSRTGTPSSTRSIPTGTSERRVGAGINRPAPPTEPPLVGPFSGPTVNSRDPSGRKSVVGLFGAVADRTSGSDLITNSPKVTESVASTVRLPLPPVSDAHPLTITCTVGDLTTIHDLRLRILVIYALTRCGFKSSILNSGRPHLRTFAQKLPRNCLGEGQMLIDAATLFRNSILDPNNVVSRGDRAFLEASAEDVARAVIWKMQGGRWSWLGELFRIVVSCTVYETERMKGKMLTIY